MQAANVLFLILLASPLMASATRGEPAPEMRFDAVIPERPVAEATMKALAGKAVVLEFWATWCAPCIASMPHLNELARQFQDRPVQFISVTDEERPVVKAFLRKRPLEGWIGLDPKRRLFQAYGVNGIPQTVLIGRTGMVAAVTRPDFVNANRLEDLLAGKPITVPPSEVATESGALRKEDGPGVNSLLDIKIRPSSTQEEGMHRTPTNFIARGFPLRLILANAYGVSPDRIEGAPVEDLTRYDVMISLPNAEGDTLNRVLQEAVCAAFHLQVRRERRDTDVLILRAPQGKSNALLKTVSNGGSMSTANSSGLQFIGVRMRDVAQALEQRLHKHVIDETGLSDQYDFNLHWNDKQPESGLDAALHQVGLILEPGRRPIEVLVADRK